MAEAAQKRREARRGAVLRLPPGARPGDQARPIPDIPAGARPSRASRYTIGHIGRRTSLFDVRMNRDLTVLVGCGLGGTSLINASVILEPKDFSDPRWPAELRELWPADLQKMTRSKEEFDR